MNELQIYRNILRLDYCAYTKHVNPGWKLSRFHRFLCDTVQDFIEEESGNSYDILIISTPPQHGKSKTITETLPSWYLGRNPDNRVIEISYSEDFAQMFGRSNLRKVKEHGEAIFNVRLGTPANATEFDIDEHPGGMISRGVLSGVTGRKANLMIIDDPIKTQQEADSKAYRDRVYGEWVSSFRTRLWIGAKVILIMTRWHEDDLAGRLIDEEEHIKVINLPIEAEENDPLGRKVGEALCPEIGKDNNWLADFKKGYQTAEGTRSWNALYQGRPTALEGNMIKREWWQYYDTLPDCPTWLMSVDAAFKDKATSDFVAITVWAKRDADIYLVDLVNKHLDLPNTMREIVRMRAMYPRCKTTLIEDKANGSAIIKILRKTMTGIIGIDPQGGKVSRVNAVIGAIESGNVHLPNRPFTSAFVEQCAEFPNGKNDDMVDSMSQGLNRLIYSMANVSIPEIDNPLEKIFNIRKKRKKEGRGAGKGDKINVV